MTFDISNKIRTCFITIQLPYDFFSTRLGSKGLPSPRSRHSRSWLSAGLRHSLSGGLEVGHNVGLRQVRQLDQINLGRSKSRSSSLSLITWPIQSDPLQTLTPLILAWRRLRKLHFLLICVAMHNHALMEIKCNFFVFSAWQNILKTSCSLHSISETKTYKITMGWYEISHVIPSGKPET